MGGSVVRRRGARVDGCATGQGENALAQVVRERQGLERQWHAVDQRLNDAVARADVTLAWEIRRELSGLEGKFAGIDARPEEHGVR